MSPTGAGVIVIPSAVYTSASTRIRPIDRPEARAASSPRVSIRRPGEAPAAKAAAAARAGATQATSIQLRFCTDPSSQFITSAEAIGDAGALAGRPATTYWDAVDELVDLDPSVLVDTEARYVDDVDVITSAGVSAGIDMALHLVARLDSVEMARTTRRGIQYDPQPPV